MEDVQFPCLFSAKAVAVWITGFPGERLPKKSLCGILEFHHHSVPDDPDGACIGHCPIRFRDCPHIRRLPWLLPVLVKVT